MVLNTRARPQPRIDSGENSRKTDKIRFTSENIEEVISELFSVLKSCNQSTVPELPSDLDLRNYSFCILNDWKKCQRIVKMRDHISILSNEKSLKPTINKIIACPLTNYSSFTDLIKECISILLPEDHKCLPEIFTASENANLFGIIEEKSTTGQGSPVFGLQSWSNSV